MSDALDMLSSMAAPFATSTDARAEILIICTRMMVSAGGPRALRTAWARVCTYHERRTVEGSEPLCASYLQRMAGTSGFQTAICIWGLLADVGLSVESLEDLKPTAIRWSMRAGIPMSDRDAHVVMEEMGPPALSVIHTPQEEPGTLLGPPRDMEDARPPKPDRRLVVVPDAE